MAIKELEEAVQKLLIARGNYNRIQMELWQLAAKIIKKEEK